MIRCAAIAAVIACASTAAVVACASTAEAQVPTEAYAVSSEGRRFRTGFDPASRISVGTSGAATVGPGSGGANGELFVGIAYRTRDPLDPSSQKVVWQVDHRALSGFVAPYVTSSGRLPSLDLALYSLSLHRHSPSPSLVLPTSPPVALPFPFDTGIEMELGRLWAPRRLHPMSEGFLRLGVARLTTFVDPWRSGVAGRSFELGVGVRYDLDVHGDVFVDPGRPLAGTKVVHRIAPMTATSARFRYQTLDGLASIDARAELVPHWASDGGFKVFASASAFLERTLFAVNDVPVSLFVQGDVRTVPRTDATPTLGYARVGAGLLVGLPLR